AGISLPRSLRFSTHARIDSPVGEGGSNLRAAMQRLAHPASQDLRNRGVRSGEARAVGPPSEGQGVVTVKVADPRGLGHPGEVNLAGWGWEVCETSPAAGSCGRHVDTHLPPH